MADMLEDCLTDLGQRRPPSAWVSTCYKLVDRQQVKQQRRQELETGATGSGAEGQKGSGSDSKSTSSSKHTVGTETHYGLRRRDEHALLLPSQRSSRAAKQESIARQLHMKKEPIDQSLTWLPPEDEEGHIEYKYKLSHPPPHPIRLQQLITQMKFRLSEGGGQCFYYLGVEDDGYPKGLGPAELDASMATLHKMAHTLDVQATLVRIFPGAHGRRCALLRVQRGMLQEVGYLDLRVAVAGCVDAGKSTLVAVLTHGANGSATLDTGRGSARVVVLRHKHEIESGRTSSLSHQFLGYDAEGRVLNYMGSSSAPTLTEVCSSASKLLTFIDMGGHERCLKTALYGMTALLPDYALLCCCAVGGLGHMSREHLAVAVALHIPVAVCITKADLVDEAGLAAVVEDIRTLVGLAWPALSGQSQSNPVRASLAASAELANGTSMAEQQTCAPQKPWADPGVSVAAVAPVIHDEDAAESVAQALGQLHVQSCVEPMPSCRTSTEVTSDACVAGATGASVQACTAPPFMVPIFPISSVSGQGLDVLHAFLRALQPSQHLRRAVTLPVTAMASAPDLTSLDTTGAQDVAHLSLPVDTSTTAAPTLPTALLPEQFPATMSSTQVAGQMLRGAHSGPAEDEGVHFQVDQTFEVPGVGSVVSGMVLSGLIRLGQVLLLGPTVTGSFVEVTITGIQRAHIPVQLVRAGQAATLALRPNNPAGASNGRQEAQHASEWRTPKPSQTIATGATRLEGHQQPVHNEHTQAESSAAASRSSTPACATPQPQPRHNDAGAMDVAPDLLELFDMDNDDEAGTNAQDGNLSNFFGVDDNPTPPRSRIPATTAAMPAASPRNNQSSRRAAAANGFGMHTGDARHAVPGSSFPPSSRPRLQHATLLYGDGHLATSPSLPSFLLSSSPSSASHRGAVLLGTALAPRTTWQFDAVLILLGGHWPPRGLVSGQWPPLESPTREMVSVTCITVQRSSGSDALQLSGESGTHDVADVTGCDGDSAAESRRDEMVMGSSCATDRSTSSSDADAGLVHAALGSKHERSVSPERLVSRSAPVCMACKRSPVQQGQTRCIALSSMQCEDTSLQIQDASSRHKHQAHNNGCEGGRNVHAAGGPQSPGETATNTSRCLQEAGQAQHKARRHGKRRACAAQFTCVIHCANVRQLARLVSMQEYHDPNSTEPQAKLDKLLCSPALLGLGARQAHMHVTPRMQAAAALLHAPWQPGQHRKPSPVAAEPLGMNINQHDADGTMGNGTTAVSSDLGCIVRATFRFEHRPEWLCSGARLVVRDRSTGHVSAAGYVQAAYP